MAVDLLVTAVLIAEDGVGRAGGPVARGGLLGGGSVGSSRGCFVTINRFFYLAHMVRPLAERDIGDACCRCYHPTQSYLLQPHPF